MRTSGYTRNTSRKSQMRPIPMAGTSPRVPAPRRATEAAAAPDSATGEGEGDRRGKGECDGLARPQHRVMPGIAHVDLEDESARSLHVVAERGAKIRRERDPTGHRGVGGAPEGDVFGTHGHDTGLPGGNVGRGPGPKRAERRLDRGHLSSPLAADAGDEVVGPYEVRHEAIDRTLVQFLGRGHLLHAPVAHDG